MTLKDAVTICFQKFVTFSGRAGRQEFWKFVLFLLLVHIVLLVINSLIFGPSIDEGLKFSIASDGTQTTTAYRNVSYTGGWLGNAFSLITLLPFTAVTWRRLHDRNRSGWWTLVPYGLLMAMGAIWFLTSEAVAVGANPQTGDPITVLVPQSIAPILILGLLALAAGLSVLISTCRAPIPGANRFGPNPNEVPS
ncbi:DUF805 domain-containing protein [Octadecabacter sp. 1_MG-2023]|uniref:DUF805 domain-containing protein n=1 Tax=unclassified Octadecabacter TaxID=196158 RepID=UPI001C092E21|nr:DUF805 domain-containing protein [Octadecabacter sp. 1_MG-2023]MBU2991769.1 DUF805 domain-containing protein [Octadecabacter sp. B2R22]MDO6735742.1 DUF805 domain-containing protein [Octadecabacter sp. 1_MG-2023]